MTVKILKTIGPRTYFTSLFLITFSVLFPFLVEKNNGQLIYKWFEISSKIIFIISFISMITVLEIKLKGSKFNDIHLIVFPMIFLFFPSFNEIKYIPILQVILLTYGQYVYTGILNSKNKEKLIFNLSLIISVISQFNYFFVFFYVLFIHKGLKDFKHLLALILPIIIIPFTLNSFRVILPSETFIHIYPAVQMKILNVQILSNAEMVWLVSLMLTIVICVFQLQQGYRKFSNPELFSRIIYITFWLFFGIAYDLLGLQISSERWFISLIPLAYFFNGFIENTKSNLLKNIFFTVAFFGIIIFKLFDIGLISPELP